ncbi:membrane protein [Burkholderia pseudomallei]|uniref:TadG family pilus assembly protein n=1 Tax=Burkholderia pseudomallei TaxID=28450 RepID=UPI000F08B0BF|nr:TadG family pilus assembly protein [Burkholderia pseudomallei]VBB98586.1 membrane protein [Burkholderia pseudomallei]
MPLARRRAERRPPARGRGPIARERGSFALVAAIWMLVAIAALGAVDIGNVFFVRRDLQRVADMAALAGAQRMDDQCAQPNAAAAANARSNGFDPAAGGNTLALACGRWDTQSNAGPSYFNAAATPLNAVQVTATQSVPYFFLGPSRTVSATSTAKATNVDQFTIGTTLASLQGGLVNNVLNALLGTNLGLSALSYQALASTQIKIGDLMAAANVLTVNELLATQVTAGQYAQLMLTALSRTQVVNANLQASVAALQAIAGAHLGGGTFRLGGQPGAPGVFALGLSDTQAAADAKINVFDALMVAAEVAAAGKPAVDVATGLQLAGQGARMKLQVIEPPTIVIGEAGTDPKTGAWRTQANNAQIRLYVSVDLGTTGLLPTGVLLPIAPLVSLVQNLIQVDLSLPLTLQVATGSAWLQSTSCAASAAASRATLGVQPGLANLCIGDVPTDLPAQQTFACNVPATLATLGVLSAPLLQVKSAVALPAVVPKASAATLTFNGVAGDADDYQTTNSNAVGSVIANALSGAAQSLTGSNGLALYVLGVSVPVGTILNPVVSVLLNLLGPVLSSLDQVVVPLLNLLGVQLGAATVHNLALTCGTAQTVY